MYEREMEEPRQAERNDEPRLTEREAAARALRNLEAAEARLRRDQQRVLDETKAKLVSELLPVLDNLDRTIKAAAGASDPALLQGAKMVRDQLLGVLAGYGVEQLETTDQPFDPNLHEAIGVIPVRDPAWHGMVAGEAERGFLFNGKLLRPAKVYVGKIIQ